MPVSDFRRLYRELCKDGDGFKREDATYRKEREEAFYRLGHDGISGISDKVNAGKHHGVVARARTVEDPQDKLRKDMELRKKKMEVMCDTAGCAPRRPVSSPLMFVKPIFVWDLIFNPTPTLALALALTITQLVPLFPHRCSRRCARTTSSTR